MIGTKNECIKWLLEQPENKYFETDEIDKDRRTLEQNKLLWKLIGLIAKEQCQDDMEVYCAILERANAKYDFIMTKPSIEEKDLRKNFRGVKFIRETEINGQAINIYKVYIGSSKMTKKEFSELLEITYQICAELQIPTLEVVV